jgi:cholesterol transport system auxiliary component
MIRRRLRAGVVLRRGAAALALVLPLAGCASGPPTTFDLSAVPGDRRPRAMGAQVAVTEPVATAPVDTDRIVVRPTPDTVALLKGAQWTERLPRLIQTRLLQSFENARLLRFVSRPDGRVVAQYSLNTEIRRFDMDLSRGEAVVEISVKLVEEGAGRIAAAKIFTAHAPGAADDGPSAAAALDAALGDVMGQIVMWTAGRV